MIIHPHTIYHGFMPDCHGDDPDQTLVLWVPLKHHIFPPTICAFPSPCWRFPRLVISLSQALQKYFASHSPVFRSMVKQDSRCSK